MNWVLILVEGQTEETFVREVLVPHLEEYNVYLTPTLATTKIVKSGTSFKGGLVSYGKAKNQIWRLLKDTSATAVTTMFDLYGLPTDFPGYQTRPKQDCYAKIAHLETAFSRDINHRQFRPYLQLHEFETFLFVIPEKTVTWLPGSNCLDQLKKIKADFASPEEINDGPDTAPSKRLVALYPGFQKTLHGPLVTIDVGLQQLRQECLHFNEWLTWLEGLG